MTEKDLAIRRRSVKSSITKIETFILTEINEDTRSCIILTRRTRLEELFREYTTIHTQLESLDEIKYGGDFDIVEKQYEKVSDIIVTLLDDRVAPPGPASANGSAASTSRIKLPKISLPTFSGDYKEWPRLKICS